jgi:hypothetical protein
MIAAILIYLSNIWSGAADPLWPHAILIGVSVVAGGAAWYGLIRESPSWSITKSLIVVGVVIESLSTICLFVVDEAISRAQQSKIATLDTEVKPRDLSTDEIKRVVDALSQFSGRRVTVQSYMGDVEGHRFLFSLARTLGKAGLKVDVGYWYPDTSPAMAFLLGTEIDAPQTQSDLADALQKVLATTQSGVRAQWYVVPGDNEVTVHIGVKPFPLQFDAPGP